MRRLAGSRSRGSRLVSSGQVMLPPAARMGVSAHPRSRCARCTATEGDHERPCCAGLRDLKRCSSHDAWHSAKALVAEGSVRLQAALEDEGLPVVVLQGQITALSADAAAFPHLLRTSSSSVPGASQPVSVALVLHASSGELLDADCSCCPGGFQPVLGSFCPCAAALLLAAAKAAAPPPRCNAAAQTAMVSARLVLLQHEQQPASMRMHALARTQRHVR